MRAVKAAAVQLSPVLYSREATVDKIVRKINELGHKGVQFATFPETIVPYYPYFSFLQPAYQIVAGREHLKLLDQAVTVPSPATHAIGDACREAGVVASIGVNERDGGTLYNTQLLFDADGVLIQRRRKITPTYHERMVWGQGDGSGLCAVDTRVGRIGQLACWEHYNPLARYALMADGEEIHSAMYPGSIFGNLFSEQTEVNVRQHALESACFVVCATAWLDADQQAQIVKDAGGSIGPIWWLLYGDRGTRWNATRRGSPIRRRRSHRRPRLRAHRQAQAADGLARPLQPARTSESAGRSNASRARSWTDCAQPCRRRAPFWSVGGSHIVTFVVNVLGWVGVVALLCANSLVSTQKAMGDSRTYQGMNLLGAILVLVNTPHDGRTHRLA